MRQLSKLESIIYLLGGITMVAGAGLYAFFIAQSIVLMQSRQRYEGTSQTIRRLRKIMTIAGLGFIIAGLFMVEDSYMFLRPVFSNTAEGYTTYVNIFHHNWVILLLISAILEMYTSHRISYELKKELNEASN